MYFQNNSSKFQYRAIITTLWFTAKPLISAVYIMISAAIFVHGKNWKTRLYKCCCICWKRHCWAANRGTKNNSAASIFVGPKKYHHSWRVRIAQEHLSMIVFWPSPLDRSDSVRYRETFSNDGFPIQQVDQENLAGSSTR